MLDLAHHPDFTAITDPISGVVSYALTRRVAPVQRPLYFANPSLSADNGILWFEVAFPPTQGTFLARIRLASPGDIRWFPSANPAGSCPQVWPTGDSALFAVGDSIWRCSAEGEVTRLCTLGDDYIAHRRLNRLTTHTSLSADLKHVLLDGHVGEHSFVALGDLSTGKVTIIREFQALHNHAHFHPSDPGQFIIAQDHTRHPFTGRHIHYVQRTFLMRTDGSGYRCINPQFPGSHLHGACHEWWLADGRIAYVDYDTGVWIFDPATDSSSHAWREPVCHAHADASARWFCADQSPYYWKEKPCKVTFFDSVTGRTVDIDSGLPQPQANRGHYHLDPHPQFSPDGQFIAYMTTRLGQPDVAVTPTAPLKARVAP